MKLERLNEQQIRCTLTKEDLKMRRIELSELAYGTDKARSLFNDLITQAIDELDFELDDMPLMIEAVPISSESIVLTLTKVDDPEELDTRFAQFAPDITADSYTDDEDDSYEPISITTPAPQATIPEDIPLVRLFSFSTIGDLISLSSILASEFTSSSSVYKDPTSGRYLLLITKSDMSIPDFNRVCNIISEYGDSERNLLATSAYLDEHYECILKGNAIHQLANI